MKRKIIMITAAVCAVCLWGCAGRTEDSVSETFVMTNPAGNEKEGSLGEEAAATEETTTEEVMPEEAVPGEKEAGETAGAGAGKVSEEPFLVENPGGEYYYADGEAPSNPQTIRLVKESESPNEIIDEEKWFAENGLTKPGFPYEDDRYRYEAYGDNGFDVYVLRLYDKETGELAANLDFSNYRYANDFAPEDMNYVEQRICYAKAEDGVLYVATAHNTYAGSSPHTAYVTAVDLMDFHVIWKTAPLMNNASSFEIIDNAIVCGYGFTAEDDFLNIIDRETGRLWEQIPIRSMANYIIWKDGILYVRTYNTDDTFSVYVESQ